MPNQHNPKKHYQAVESKAHKDATCCHYPEFKRLKYFYGQMLGQHDFQTEQDYFRNKLKLHNRCLHGYGTVCGLEVIAVAVAKDCKDPSHDKRKALEAEKIEIEKKLKELTRPDGRKRERPGAADTIAKLRGEVEANRRQMDELSNDHSCDDEGPALITIECGMALDCEGNELVVRRPLDVDLWHMLDIDERVGVDPEGQTLYVSICHCELPIDPVRPVLTDTCGASPDCVYGKLADTVRVKVTFEPHPDEPCETCCTACGDACLLLAVIHGFKKGKSPTADQIDNSVRRMVGPYAPTTITGVSWSHGAEYTRGETADILGTDDEKGGLEVRFSRPILTETLTRGVVDIWVLTGGGGDSGAVTHHEGVFVGLPSSPTTQSFRFRQVTGETLQDDDRVLITIRTSFILDACCHAVDGDNLGGRVPILLPDYEKNKRESGYRGCASPPQRTVPWTSGNGTCGGTFESWFYVKSRDRTRGADRNRDRDARNY